MNRAVAALIAALVTGGGVAVGGCGAPASAQAGARAPGQGAASTPGTRLDDPSRPNAPPGQPLLPVDGVPCGDLACVYHAGAGSYFACTSAAAGTCFHFGAPCTPRDPCMFDGTDGRYKRCDAVVEGACTRWGATCAPASGCMFNPGDGVYHRCEQAAGGVCSRWGARCAP